MGIAAVSILIPPGDSRRVDNLYEKLLPIPNPGVSDPTGCFFISTFGSPPGGADPGGDPLAGTCGSASSDAIAPG